MVKYWLFHEVLTDLFTFSIHTGSLNSSNSRKVAQVHLLHVGNSAEGFVHQFKVQLLELEAESGPYSNYTFC